MPRRSSTSATSVRSALVGRGIRRVGLRDMITQSDTVTGKFQFDRLELRHVADREVGAAGDLAARGLQRAEQQAQQRRLARAGRPDDPGELPLLDGVRDVAEHRAAAVGEPDSVEGDEGRVSDHWG